LKRQKQNNSKEKKVMKKLTILFIAAALLGLAGMSMAQNDPNHTVTINVASISAVDVSTDIIMNITTADAGQDPDPATNSDAVLSWTANGGGSAPPTKEIQAAITAGTLGTLTLEVVALITTQTGSGTAVEEAEFALSGTAAPIVSSVEKTRGSATLTYTATADVDADIDATVVTVTYSIVES
jgi:hypothetical protein